MLDGYLTAQEAAERYGVTASAVTMHARAGRLPGAHQVHTRGPWLVPEAICSREWWAANIPPRGNPTWSKQ